MSMMTFPLSSGSSKSSPVTAERDFTLALGKREVMVTVAPSTGSLLLATSTTLMPISVLLTMVMTKLSSAASAVLDLRKPATGSSCPGTSIKGSSCIAPMVTADAAARRSPRREMLRGCDRAIAVVSSTCCSSVFFIAGYLSFVVGTRSGRESTGLGASFS